MQCSPEKKVRKRNSIKCKLEEDMTKRQTNFRDDTVPNLNEQVHSRRGKINNPNRNKREQTFPESSNSIREVERHWHTCCNLQIRRSFTATVSFGVCRPYYFLFSI